MYPLLHDGQQTQVSLYYGYKVQSRDYKNSTLIDEVSFKGIHSSYVFKDGHYAEQRFQEITVIFYNAEKSSKSGFVIGTINNTEDDVLIVSIYASEKLMEFVKGYLTLESYVDINENRISLNFGILHISKPKDLIFRLKRYLLGKLNEFLPDAMYKSDRYVYELMGIEIESYPNGAIRQLEDAMLQIKDSDKIKYSRYKNLLDATVRQHDLMKRVQR